MRTHRSKSSPGLQERTSTTRLLEGRGNHEYKCKDLLIRSGTTAPSSNKARNEAASIPFAFPKPGLGPIPEYRWHRQISSATIG
mmetsp:Transcript_26666/g.59252  ORF Transcript_26666/g.59252 Transcript_26666/m.59252 type:complete len:84 (-) Transcript_26666:37-288(-)